MGGLELRFATNGAEFDFPDYDGRPSHPYLIASTPRCGSNFLQRALWRTHLAGAPEEYLTRTTSSTSIVAGIRSSVRRSIRSS